MGSVPVLRINGDYQIARHGWIADYNDPMTFLDMWLAGEGTGVWANNDAHCDNNPYDKLVNDARVEKDAAKRRICSMMQKRSS